MSRRRTVPLANSEHGYQQVRDLLAEYKLDPNPTYSGWGLEVYQDLERKLQMKVDWDYNTAVIKEGF